MRAARRRAGISQVTVADALGTTRRQISRWEHGVYTPRVDELHAYAEACGATLAELTEGVAS